MVFIKIKGKDGILIESKNFKDIDEEEKTCEDMIKKLHKKGEDIIRFSLRRVVYTLNEYTIGLLKDLSLPNNLSFWIKPLSRDFTKHEVWFESKNYKEIFNNFKQLKIILDKENKR